MESVITALYTDNCTLITVLIITVISALCCDHCLMDPNDNCQPSQSSAVEGKTDQPSAEHFDKLLCTAGAASGDLQ